MAAQPPDQAGQLSPDGMWQWDGQRWVPSAAQRQVPNRRSQSWIWWLVGGCAVSLLIGMFGAVVGGKALFDRFQQGAFTCLPSDFPTYPGAKVASEVTSTGTKGRVCTMVLYASDPIASVGDYYQTQLDSADWAVDSVELSSGTITFHRRSRPQTRGTVKLTAIRQGTQIGVVLDT